MFFENINQFFKVECLLMYNLEAPNLISDLDCKSLLGKIRVQNQGSY